MLRSIITPCLLATTIMLGGTATPSFANLSSWLAPLTRSTSSNVCARGQNEHTIDWMAFTGSDIDPAGVPRRVEGRLPGRALGGDTIDLRYGGLTRRFDFDSPRAMQAGNLPDGFFRIDYDLLQFEEFAEMHMVMPRALDRFTLVFGDIGDTWRADGGVRDAVWVEGHTSDGRRIAPGYFYPTMAAEDSKTRVTRKAQREQFGAPWITGDRLHERNASGKAIQEPIGAAFREPVTSITIRFSGLPFDQGGGWAHGTSVNPPQQRVDILSGAYCG